MREYFSHERISILLEFISFFLVTTDLYGHKRFEILEDTLIKTTGDVSDKTKEKVGKVSTILAWLYILSLFFKICFLNEGYKNYYWMKSIFQYAPNFQFRVIIILMAVLIIAFTVIILRLISGLYSYAGTIVIYLLFTIRYIFLLLIKQLLKLKPLEGWLLIIGTLLFLVSKIISFVYAT